MENNETRLSLRDKIVGYAVLYGLFLIPWWIGMYKYATLIGTVLSKAIIWIYGRVQAVRQMAKRMDRRLTWIDEKIGRDEARDNMYKDFCDFYNTPKE